MRHIGAGKGEKSLCPPIVSVLALPLNLAPPAQAPITQGVRDTVTASAPPLPYSQDRSLTNTRGALDVGIPDALTV
jgi:hypothetical protein